MIYKFLRWWTIMIRRSLSRQVNTKLILQRRCFDSSLLSMCIRYAWHDGFAAVLSVSSFINNLFQERPRPKHPEVIRQMVLSHNKSAVSLRWNCNMFLQAAVYFFKNLSAFANFGRTVGPSCNVEINLDIVINPWYRFQRILCGCRTFVFLSFFFLFLVFMSWSFNWYLY